jgi:CHAT domain-containing protein
MGKDYTKKSQALAEQSKVVQANMNKIQESMQLRDEYAQKLSQITQVLNEDMESEEDLINMKENDPVGYAVKIAEQTENQRKMKMIEQEQQRVAMQQRAAQQEHFAQNISHQSKKLTELIPEFSDTKKAEQVKRDIRSYGKDMGFSDQEMSTVYDARHVSMLHKAMKYDRLMSNKGKTKKQVTNAPRMTKNRGKVKNADVYTKQKRRLKSSGKVEDAVSVFKNFL